MNRLERAAIYADSEEELTSCLVNSKAKGVGVRDIAESYKSYLRNERLGMAFALGSFPVHDPILTLKQYVHHVRSRGKREVPQQECKDARGPGG